MYEPDYARDSSPPLPVTPAIAVPLSLSPQHRADDAWDCPTCILLHMQWLGGSVYRPATFQGDAVHMDLIIWLHCLGV